MRNDVFILLRCQKGCAKLKAEPILGNLKEIITPSLWYIKINLVKKEYFRKYIKYGNYIFKGGNYSKKETICKNKVFRV